MRNFCILNGELEKIEKLQLVSPFVENETISRYIRLYNTCALCLRQHVSKIEETAALLRITLHTKFDFEHISRYVTKLLDINKVYKGGVCRILVFWNTNHPETSQFAIFVTPLEQLGYQFNMRGLTIGLNSIIKVREPLYPCQYSGNSSLLNSMRIHSFDNAFAMCYFTNNQEIVGISQGNLAYIKDDEIHICKNNFTEPFADFFFEYLRIKKWKIIDSEFFLRQNLFNCDEMFLIGQFVGLQWITKIRDANNEEKTFSFKHAKNLFTELQSFINERLSK